MMICQSSAIRRMTTKTQSAAQAYAVMPTISASPTSVTRICSVRSSDLRVDSTASLPFSDSSWLSEDSLPSGTLSYAASASPESHSESVSLESSQTRPRRLAINRLPTRKRSLSLSSGRPQCAHPVRETSSSTHTVSMLIMMIIILPV